MNVSINSFTSGLPERNGDRHAAEIANLCIELMFITPGNEFYVILYIKDV